MRLKSRLTTAGVALVVASSLAACGSEDGAKAVEGSWTDVVAAANEEGKVNFYSILADAQNARLVEAFNQQYPEIKVQVTRGASELISRIDAEIKSDSDGGDVFIHIDPAWFIDHEAELMAIDGPSTEGWNDEGWVAGNKAIVPSISPYSIFVWNTKKFPEGFETWDELLDPSVKGLIGLRSDVTTSLAGFLDFQERTLGAEYLSDMGGLQPKFYPSVVPMAQAVASGEIGVTNASSPSTIKTLQTQGAPIEFAIPKPSFWTEWAGGVIQKSKRPNAARVFLDFIMTEEGQAALNGDGWGAANRENVEGALELPQDATVLDSNAFSDPEVIAEFDTKFNQWFN